MAAEKGVMDWKLVTPKTREEKGNVIVTTKGVKYNENPEPGKPELKTAEEDREKISNWRKYIEDNREALEDNWKNAVRAEAERRSDAGQPVMVSIYGDRNPMRKDVPIYTAQNQIAQGDDNYHKVGDDKCLFSKDGKGEIACFDDFYGRGYTFKFLKRDKDGNLVKNSKGKNEKFENGGHVLITSLPQNSRNLEQFLFRVARGGDKGSSSIVISPTDPVLIDYLAKIENEKGQEEATNYLKQVLSGKRSVDQIVADIYPEQTKEIFAKKANEIDMSRLYKSALNTEKESIQAVEEVGTGEISNLSEKYTIQYKKEMLKRMKMDRQFGIASNEEEKYNNIVEIEKATVKSLVQSKQITSVAEIVAVLPLGLTQEELKEMIPDQTLRKKVIDTIGKIDAYIERKNNGEKGEKLNGEASIKLAEAIEKLTIDDPELNAETLKEALIAVREERLNNRETKTEEKEVEENGIEQGG